MLVTQEADPQHLPLLQRLSSASLLVFANKQDLPGAMTSQQISDTLDLAKVQDRHWVIQGCSAVTGDGLLDGVQWLVRDIASRIYMFD